MLTWRPSESSAQCRRCDFVVTLVSRHLCLPLICVSLSKATVKLDFGGTTLAETLCLVSPYK